MKCISSMNGTRCNNEPSTGKLFCDIHNEYANSSDKKDVEMDPHERYLHTCAMCVKKITGSCISLYCRHIFHVECAENWIDANETCPFCLKDAVNRPVGYGNGYQNAYFNRMRAHSEPVKIDQQECKDHNTYKDNVYECMKLSKAATEVAKSINSITEICKSMECIHKIANSREILDRMYFVREVQKEAQIDIQDILFTLLSQTK